jgi:phosphoglycolate phosphatase-like HAD superfamily hydrolase
VSLVLFDIDGTLLLSGGAGVRAMTRAFAEVFGITNAFARADVAGRTDTFLLSAALRYAGIDDTPEQHVRFRDVYVPLLREEMTRPPQGRCGLMPGIDDLLHALAGNDATHLALLTGNFEHAAYTKLAHFGIHTHFPWGVFGEESADRNELARVARRRAVERAVPAMAVERTVVIGDTPHDVACAQAIGARVIAVATGNYSMDALQAAGADVTLSDLSETRRILELLA